MFYSQVKEEEEGFIGDTTATNLKDRRKWYNAWQAMIFKKISCIYVNFLKTQEILWARWAHLWQSEGHGIQSLNFQIEKKWTSVVQPKFEKGS